MTKIMVQAREILPKYDPDKDAGAQGGGSPGSPPPPPSGGSGLIGGSNLPQDPPKKPLIEIARR